MESEVGTVPESLNLEYVPVQICDLRLIWTFSERINSDMTQINFLMIRNGSILCTESEETLNFIINWKSWLILHQRSYMIMEYYNIYDRV